MTIERHRIKSRESWLKRRQKDATASDIAAICGVHPKRSPMSVYLEKKGLRRDEDSNIMRRGRWFEPSIQAAFVDVRPDLKLQRPNLYIRDSELRIGATLDFLAIDEHDRRINIEGKVVAYPEFFKHWVENGCELDEGDDEKEVKPGVKIVVPLWYQLQALTQHKLAATDWPMIGALAVDAYRADLYALEVDVVESAWNFVKERVRDFWTRFDAGVAPDLSPALDAEALAALYPSDNGDALDFSSDPEVKRLLEEWEQKDALKSKFKTRELKPLEDRIKEIKTTLKDKLGSAAYGRLPGWEFSWKTQSRAAMAATSFRVMRKRRTRI